MGIAAEEPGVNQGDAHPRGRFLLASHGVRRMLRHRELGHLLYQTTSGELAGQARLHHVEDRHNHDGATVEVPQEQS